MTDDISQLDPLGDRLLSAASEVFSERGYDRATVSEIARRAGVTTGAIYSRFRGKADLMAEALARTVGNEIDRLLPQAPEGGTALLGLLGHHLVDGEQQSEWLLMEAIVASRRDPELADMIRHRLDGEHTRIAKIVDEGRSDGNIDPALDIGAVAHFSLALGLGMSLQQLINRPQPDANDWHPLIDRLLAAARPLSGQPLSSTQENLT